MMNKKAILLSVIVLTCTCGFAQSERNQPARANPRVIEIDNKISLASSSGQGKELPANSVFKFDYRFFVSVQHEGEVITGHFDLDSRSGTIRSTRDDMPGGTYIVRTPANKLYTYAEADGQKIVMEMNHGDNTFDIWFSNQANSSAINFNAGRHSGMYLKKISGGQYSISEQTIPTEEGFAVLYTTPLDFAVHTGGSFDPMSGLGVMYDFKAKKHYLVAKIESSEMTSIIGSMRKMNTILDGSTYFKMSGMMSFSEADMPAEMKKDVDTYQKNNNMEDLLGVANIYGGGDIQMQIDEANNKLKELDEYLGKSVTPKKKNQLMEERRKVAKAKEILTRHLTEIKEKTPAYWQSNMNRFMELKSRQAQELVDIKQ
ncbi:DUF4252 domain-containing protein [Sphingobacterium phlebotomi]|uniref:DUF4252 domain-containing protein n=1 Tax=Sphingobacterium phlebotomi TaxID=2605433 RepID=A0A5D4H6N6_9SPHI|nr:DUF4252 domain-containing protein [Sphingobacterium phlebotomi]TYR35115.1 DUF4252 domain-containing protein [Sphingobacterium phlebotomi]